MRKICSDNRDHLLTLSSFRFERRYFEGPIGSLLRRLLEFPIICEALFRVALRLYLSNSLAVTDSGKCRYLHDCARATDSAAPSKRQWAGRLRAAIAIGLGMLRHGILLSGSNMGSGGITSPPLKQL